jgi:hypothetical protein
VSIDGHSALYSLSFQHLQPAKPADPQRVRQLIADLDSSEFARREAVYHKLATLGDKVRPALHKALEGKPLWNSASVWKRCWPRRAPFASRNGCVRFGQFRCWR